MPHADELTDLTTEQVNGLDRMCPMAAKLSLGTILQNIIAWINTVNAELADQGYIS